MNSKTYRGLIFSSLVFLVNLSFLFLNKNFFDFIFINSILFAGIVDFYKMIIPDISSIIILIISFINFDIYNVFYASFILFITLVFYNSNRLGFGDVKLLTTITLYVGFEIFYFLIISAFIVFSINFNKKETKIPFGFYIMLAIIVYYFIEVIL
ncbi:MAG: prepilin peptidase [Thermotogota bacterium]